MEAPMDTEARNPVVIQAAQWLADQRDSGSNVIVEMKERFGLKALEACEAAALARKFRITRRAHG